MILFELQVGVIYSQFFNEIISISFEPVVFSFEID